MYDRTALALVAPTRYEPFAVRSFVIAGGEIGSTYNSTHISVFGKGVSVLPDLMEECGFIYKRADSTQNELVFELNSIETLQEHLYTLLLEYYSEDELESLFDTIDTSCDEWESVDDYYSSHTLCGDSLHGTRVHSLNVYSVIYAHEKSLQQTDKFIESYIYYLSILMGAYVQFRITGDCTVVAIN